MTVERGGNSGDSAEPEHKETVCEGNKGWFKCKTYEMIKLRKVVWGREDDETCSSDVPVGLNMDMCKGNDFKVQSDFEKVHSNCKNLQACEVPASNIFFDDNTCPSTYKYLQVSYDCIPDESNAVDVTKEAGRKKRSELRGKRSNTKFASLLASCFFCYIDSITFIWYAIV
jgi:hypothetical protein